MFISMRVARHQTDTIEGRYGCALSKLALLSNDDKGNNKEDDNNDETIASLCQTHGKNVHEVVSRLNEKLGDANIAVITCEELKQKIDSDNKPVMLDIRESWERDISKIEGSHIINAENNEHVLGTFAKDREIVLIDWKQDRGPSFQKWLNQRGFTNIKCLEGGIDQWSEKIDTKQNRYDIDEDDGYRYEDIIEEQDGHDGHDDHEGHDHP